MRTEGRKLISSSCLSVPLLGLKTIITKPRLEFIGCERRPIAALIKSLIIFNLT